MPKRPVFSQNWRIFSQPEDFIGIYSRIQKALSRCIPKKAIKSLGQVTINRGTFFIWPKKIFISFLFIWTYAQDNKRNLPL